MNIVFIVLDTQRSDHLGCYGYWRKDISPRIDQIAAEGVMFKDFHASGIATGPGFSCLHSGLCCASHEYYLTPWNRPNMIHFDDAIPTAADFFRENGYITCAIDNLMNFGSPMSHIARGYNYYINGTRTTLPKHHYIVGDEVNALALPWLHTNAKEKFFMFIHYWDPHQPYNHPESFRGRYKKESDNLPKIPCKAGYDYVQGWGAAHLIHEGEEQKKYFGDVSHDLYDEEVYYVDYIVGQIYDTLAEEGILDDTCIIITSDHGEGLGEHDYWGHKHVDQATIRVPLIIRYPEIFPQGKIVEGFAQHIDVLPTMIDIAGIPCNHGRFTEVTINEIIATKEELASPKTQFDGVSLLPLIRDEAAPRETAFVEGAGGGRKPKLGRAIIQGNWKVVKYFGKEKAEIQLYNLKDDPAEIVDLAEKEPEKCEEMLKEMDRIIESIIGDKEDPCNRFVAEYT